MDVFYEGRKLGLRYDLYCYASLFRALNAQGQYELIATVYDFMNVDRVQIDSSVYNILLNAFCETLRLTLGVEIVEKMMKLGVQPNMETLDKFVEALVEGNRRNDADFVIQCRYT